MKTTAAFVGCAALACALFWPWVHFAWVGRSVALPEGLSFGLLRRILKEMGDGSYPVSGLLIVGIAAGVTAILRHGRIGILPWLAAWFAVPPCVIYLLDRWAGGSLTIGQLLPCTPPLLIIAGYGMSHVGERLTILDQLPSRVSSPALVYAAALVLASGAIAQSHWKRVPADWQGTASYLQETLRVGDTLVVPAGLELLEYYAPRLSEFSSAEPFSGTGRRFVVCLATLRPDPCASVRTEAKRDPSWGAHEFVGLTVFSHE